jgi:ABC-type lipoprotein export system ATPase subunit
MIIRELFNNYPFVEDIFMAYQIEIDKTNGLDLEEYLQKNISDNEWQSKGIAMDEFLNTITELIKGVEDITKEEKQFLKVETLTILGGFDKDKQPENIELEIKKGEIISVVGPTGSGKSQLLADIEWLSDRDTASGRKILINGENVPRDVRYSTDKKLVAQLSQNMNFVVDLTVEEFLRLHAESRMVSNVEEKVKEVIEVANKLAGESFSLSMPITSLSGGQSRALMIADTGILSKSPIVLIDEIENAGINKQKALEFLVSADKIVLIATHDPVLALMADKRLVIKNGAISEVIYTSREEKESLTKLLQLNDFWNGLREKIRYGEKLRQKDFVLT